MGSFVSVSSTQELGIVKLTDRSEEDSLDSVTIHSNCLPSTVPITSRLSGSLLLTLFVSRRHRAKDLSYTEPESQAGVGCQPVLVTVCSLLISLVVYFLLIDYLPILYIGFAWLRIHSKCNTVPQNFFLAQGIHVIRSFSHRQKCHWFCSFSPRH